MQKISEFLTSIVLSLTVLSLSTFFLILSKVSIISAEVIHLIKPAVHHFQNNKSYNEKSDNSRIFENRKGYIEFNSELIFPEININVNDTLRISFFDNTIYDCKIEKIDKNQNGTITISGRIKDHDFSTLIITLDRNNFILYLKDLDKNYEYTGKGSVTNKIGTITEIDVFKRPTNIHLSPLTSY